MLFSFNNKKKQEPAGLSEAQNRIAGNIVYRCIRWQSKWAAWMQCKTERLSNKGKSMLLVLFCLLAGGYSCYLAINSFSGKQVVPFPIISLKQLNPSGPESTYGPVVITEEEYRKIQRFRQYMDSLAQTSSGRKFQDSMLASRSGLMDSVLLFENLYQSQIKNKP